MKMRDVTDAIIAYHPAIDENNTCDGYICGNPNDVCTGIVTACYATIGVIQRATDLKCNLIIVHEPTFSCSIRGYV